MARAPTSGELVKLRSDQRSKLFAAVLKGETVYSARVNQTTFTNPMVAVTYDGGSGTLAEVLEGMTVLIGTSAGAYDKGMARVRKAPSSTVLYIGETSEIAWVDNLYLTVVREWALWQRHIRTVGGVAYMDYDVAYTDQHAACDPVVIMGPPQVVWLDNGLATITPSSTGSWVPSSTIASQVWTAPGSESSSDLTTETPTIGYDSAGTFYISCTQTAANSKVKTRWLPVFVFDTENPPLEVAEVGGCEMSKDSGGWDFSISVYARAGMDAIRKRALVVLFSQDWYGLEEGSIGPLAGSENVLAVGWIGLERIIRRKRAGKVDFSVWGPAHWLGQMTGYPMGIENKTGAAAAWTQFHDLTVDAGLWHLATWRTTMSLAMDVFSSGNTLMAPTLEPLIGSIWAQLGAICHDTILSDPLCDRYGRLWVEQPVWALPDADRSSVPVVLILTEDDWAGEMELEVDPAGGAGMVEASGIAYDGSPSRPLFSHAPGDTLGHFGGMVAVDNLLLDDQDAINDLAGKLYAHENNPYPAVDIDLAENNRLIDVAPRSRIAAPLASGDTPRELALPDLYLLPTRVAMAFDGKNGAITFEIEAEGETSGPAGVTYVPPTNTVPKPKPNPPTPPLPPWFPPTPWFPPVIVVPPVLDPEAVCKSASPGSVNGPYGLIFSPATINAGEDAFAYFPCWVRQSNGYGQTEVKVGGRFGGDSQTNFALVAIDAAQNAILTPSSKVDYAGFSIFTFAPPAGATVAGFKLSLNIDGGFTYGGLLQYGLVEATSTSGAQITGLLVGQYYAIENYGGPMTVAGGYQVYDVTFSNDGGSTWSGGIGKYFDYPSGQYGYHLDAPTWGINAEAINNLYGRFYFHATTTSVKIRFAGAEGSGQSGNISWALRTAIPSRKINLSGCDIRNICAP